ncbi:MAG: ABC-type transport system involved in cytochrome c biosis, permease component [Verrucomicrobiota bacterium]|jgi:cytochrome c-type biogenesis protein CcsB
MKLVLALLLATSAALPAAAPVADLSPWESLVVQDSGRRKPLGTFGHEVLIKIAGRDPITLKDGSKLCGTDFAFAKFYATRDFSDEPIILVSYRPLVEKLGLDAAHKRFSRKELAGASDLTRLAQEAAALRQAGEPVPRLDTEAQTVIGRIQLFDALGNTSAFLLVPPPSGSATGTPWLTIDQIRSVYPTNTTGPILKDLRAINVASHGGDDKALAETSRRLETDLRALNPAVYPTEKTIARELSFNRAKPFDTAMWLFAGATILLGAGARHGWRHWILRGGVAVTAVGFAFMIWGILQRVLIAGRAPVTNMYESIVWVSMGTVLFGLIFYAVYRNRLMLLSALPVSFLCLLLVRNLPVAMPARLDPLVPVLRDNFWLTVHVLTITLSYAAFAFALGFAHVVLWRYIRQPGTAGAMRPLHDWLYRMMFVGLILLAAGTILGGVWANYSWGRFWGWDPKETWAFIALLMYVVAIHGKMAGWWGDFGIAVAAVVNFAGIIMAWYGVNYILGAGLHSYGFGVGGEGYVLAFLTLEAIYVGLAIMRHRGATKHQPVRA